MVGWLVGWLAGWLVGWLVVGDVGVVGVVGVVVVVLVVVVVVVVCCKVCSRRIGARLAQLAAMLAPHGPAWGHLRGYVGPSSSYVGTS